MTREKFSNWIWSGFFTAKKLSFWLQTSLSEPYFWLAPLWVQLGMAHPLRLTGVKSADFYPPNSRFWYFFGFFWLGCLEILVLAMPESLEAMSVQKSPKMPLWNFLTFFDFFFSFFKNGCGSRKNDLSDTKQRQHMLQTSYIFEFWWKKIPPKFLYHRL